MFAFLTKLLLVARSRLKSRASLEAENLVLRQQLIVLSRKSPIAGAAVEHRSVALRLAVSMLYPSILNAITVVQPETVIRWHRRGFPRLLALEISPRRRPSKDRLRDASTDPTDEPREPAVGRTADPRRIVDARNRSR